MGANKEWFIKIRDEDYRSLPSQTREMFTSEKVVYPDEHDTLYETDEQYTLLYKAHRKAKKKLDDYKYNLRHKN